MTARDPAAWYRLQADTSAQHAAQSELRVRRVGHFRLAAFALIALTAAWTYVAPPASLFLPGTALALAVALFLVLIAYHRQTRTTLTAMEERRRYFETGTHRVARDWAALRVPRMDQVAADHPYAGDLSITGRAGLFQLVDVVSSAPARPTLLRWLLGDPPSAAEIVERQDAARELATRDEVRVELGVTARGIGELNPASLDDFLTWCEYAPWTAEHAAAVWGGRALTSVAAITLLLQVVGALAHPYWLIAVLVGRAVGPYLRSRVGDASRLPALSLRDLRGHRDMFARLTAATFESQRLTLLCARMRDGAGAAAQLARLDRIAAWAEVRHSPMLHFALDWLLLWDFHVAVALDGWRRTAGRAMRDWMAALAEVESLAALATLSHDQPDWAFPDIDESKNDVTLDAAALAHPLLPNGDRVANDVTIGPPGTFLLVTGSNMSGKSTLLRAVGTNAVLAQAGGPVCAARYRSPLVSLRTSIRIEDSLADGVSLFMAELRRLRTIVDAARAREGGRPVLYLLDEILHGTNSAERRVAARTVIGHLLHAGAIGAVTTHDLTLAADGPIAAAARPVAFSETVDRTAGTPTLRFDYHLRPGLATSTNALALLEIVGLGPSASS